MSAVGSHAAVFRRGETVGVNFGRVPVFREANARVTVFSSFPESHELCPAEGGLVQGSVHLVAGAGETVTFVILHLLGEGIHFGRLVVTDADFRCVEGAGSAEQAFKIYRGGVFLVNFNPAHVERGKSVRGRASSHTDKAFPDDGE